MSRARFVSAARLEFLAAVAHYEAERPGLGASFADAVQHTLVLAIAFPYAGVSVRGMVRKILVRGFPFALVYRPSKAGIVVFAIAHASRRPGYWVSRVQEPSFCYAEPGPRPITTPIPHNAASNQNETEVC